MVRLQRAPLVLFSLAVLCAGFVVSAEPPWAGWSTERDPSTGAVIRSAQKGDAEAPRYLSILMSQVGATGHPKTDLDAALAMLWLDMHEVEAVDVVGGDTIIWGDVESEYGSRRFVARLGRGADPRVEVLLATTSDFDRLGGAEALGARLDAAQGPDALDGPARQVSTSANGTVVSEAADDGRPVAGAADEPVPTEEWFPGALAPAPIVVTSVDGSQSIPGWHLVAGRQGQSSPDPSDPGAPRLVGGSLELGPSQTVADLFRNALAAAGLEEIEHPEPREIEKYPLLASNRSYVVFGSARSAGKPVRFYATVTQRETGSLYATEVLLAAPEVFDSWSGPVLALTRGGFVEDPRAFTSELRKKVSSANAATQGEVFAFFANKKIQSLYDQMLGQLLQSQMNSLQMLQQMNSNIQTETSCLLTSGCTIEYDGVGNAQMNVR